MQPWSGSNFSPAPSLCGTGGCVYAVFDGKSLAFRGQLFGNAVRDANQRFNGWAVLDTFSHISAYSTAYGVFAFLDSTYLRALRLELPSKVAHDLLQERPVAPD